MALSDVCIKRPVFATVLNLLIIVLGIMAWRYLPVREYPDIDTPVVSIMTIYFGASPQTVETTITEPLEQALNGIEGIRSIRSTSAYSNSSINVEFTGGINVDIAATDISNALQRAVGSLPQEAEQPVIRKSDSSSSPIMWISLIGSTYNEVEKTDFAERLVKSRLQLLPGVSQVMIGGERQYAMRVWLDPAKMAARSVEPGDVRRAIRENNLQVPAGELLGSSRKFTVNVDAQIDDPRVFERLVIRRDGNQVVRISDVGWVEMGSANYRTITRSNGVPTVGIGVMRQSTANELEVSKAVRAAIPEIEAALPEGLKLVTAVDSTIFVEQSLAEAWRTLILVLGLVVLVNLVFLRSVTSTIITSVAIPISLVGTIAAIAALGFSINVLTVLALILAIGLLVDDSIVVLENIYRRQELGELPRRAAWNGAREVVLPVIATSAAVIAVLLPLAVIPGNTGKLFREFAWTMASAVAISTLVALTAVPMACSLYLRLGRQHGRMYYVIEGLLESLSGIYRKSLHWSLRHRGVVGVVFLASVIGTVAVVTALPKTLVEVEDRGQIMTMIRAPQGSTSAYTDRAMRQAEGILQKHPEIEGMFAALAMPFAGPADTSSAIVFTRLKPWRDRDVKQQQIVGELFGPYMAIPEALVFPVNPPSLGANRRSADLEIVLRSPDASLEEFEEVASSLVARMREMPGVVNADHDVRLDNPQLDIEIDREQAADLGVTTASVAEAIRLLVSEGAADEFVLRNKQYDVVIALAAAYRAVPEQLAAIHVRAAGGKMVPLASLVRAIPTTSAASLSHYDLQRSATVTGNLAAGANLGDVLPGVLSAADEVLPEGWSTALGGVSREFVESSGALTYAFLLALAVIYLVLAAQFESFVHPFTVMLSVPLASLGALGTLYLTGNTLNLFSGVGVILLIGLVTKNAILLVDFANQERARGTELIEALAKAGRTRFRPILMTSMTTIFGAIPLLIATGAGAENRRPIGAALVGGLLFSTVFTLLLIPALHVFVIAVAERLGLSTIPPAVELDLGSDGPPAADEAEAESGKERADAGGAIGDPAPA